MRTDRLMLRRSTEAGTDAVFAMLTDWTTRHAPGLPLVARSRPAHVASQRVAVRAGLARAEHRDATGYDGVDRSDTADAGPWWT